MKQIVGPPWLDHNEYDIAARAFEGATKNRWSRCCARFSSTASVLKQHSESKMMRVYELEVGKDGPKIKPPVQDAGLPRRPWISLRGDMRQFADLLAVQFSMPAPEEPGVPVKAGGPAIPVLDKTGLQGIYDFSVDQRPELGTDIFTAWKRALEDQLGLKIESRMDHVAVVVVDDATKIPTAN